MRSSLFLFSSLVFLFPAFAAEPSVVPERERYFKIIRTEEPQYPLSLQIQGVKDGSVRAILHVDAQGKLVDYLIVAYSRKAFADEAVRALQHWEFEPERVHGKPIDTVIDVGFEFELSGLIVVQGSAGDAALVDAKVNGGDEYAVCSLKHLDCIPTPLSVVSPVYPKEWADRGITGRAVVDFYIDETGRVRMAAALSWTHEILSVAAVEAVKNWRFSPPTRQARPVLVHVRQTFEFRKERVIVN